MPNDALLTPLEALIPADLANVLADNDDQHANAILTIDVCGKQVEALVGTPDASSGDPLLVPARSLLHVAVERFLRDFTALSGITIMLWGSSHGFHDRRLVPAQLPARPRGSILRTTPRRPLEIMTALAHCADTRGTGSRFAIVWNRAEGTILTDIEVDGSFVGAQTIEAEIGLDPGSLTRFMQSLLDEIEDLAPSVSFFELNVDVEPPTAHQQLEAAELLTRILAGD